MGDASTAFPGAGGQFPGLPHPTGMGLPVVPSIGGAPQTFPPGMTGLPSGQMPVSGLPTIGSTTPGLPSGIPSAQGLPGMASSGLPGLGGISAGPQVPGLPSGGFPTGIPTPGLTPPDLSSKIGAAQGLPGLPTSSTPSGITGIGPGQLPLPGFAASQSPSPMGLSTPGLPSNLGPSPGIPGVSLPSLPSEIPSEPGLLPIPVNILSGPTPQGMGPSQGLPSLPTQPSQSGIAGFGLGHGQLPIAAQDSPFGGVGGSISQIPGPGIGMPTSLTSAGGMVPLSSALSGSDTPGPGSQANLSMVPPQAPIIPTDMTSGGGMVPTSTALGFPGTPGLREGGYESMIPGSAVNSGMVPQGGISPSSAAMPTQYSGDAMVPAYGGAVDEMGAQQLQQMGLPPNIPNPDLLVRTGTDACKSHLEVQIYMTLQCRVNS